MNSGAENESNLQKQIKILENRLDKANQKFNETTANNKELKNLIDSLRRERVIFDSLYMLKALLIVNVLEDLVSGLRWFS